MRSLYGYGGILQTRLTAADQDIKYAESDFQTVNYIIIGMWKDQGSKATTL
jgi:hypothetical protein